MKSQKNAKPPQKQPQQTGGMMITGQMMNVAPQKQPTVPLQPKQVMKPAKQSVQSVAAKTNTPQQKPKQPKQENKKETKKLPKQEILLPIIEEIKDQDQENQFEKDDEGPQFSISQGGLVQKEQAQAIYRKDPIVGEVTVKYSHYKEKFQIVDGILYEKQIDEQYCLSFAFKGDYKLLLRKEEDPLKQYLEKLPQGGAWKGCEENKIYLLEVDEDPVQTELENKNKKVYQAPKQSNEPVVKNKKIELLTDELKGLSIEQLKEKDSKYKELIEARDIEDILYK